LAEPGPRRHGDRYDGEHCAKHPRNRQHDTTPRAEADPVEHKATYDLTRNDSDGEKRDAEHPDGDALRDHEERTAEPSQ
ncbi:hypothetical protein NAI58_10570, partial [Francisella tularensis subsp. holarctica]